MSAVADQAVLGARARRRALPSLGPLGWTCAGAILLFALLAVAGPLIAPYSATELDLANVSAGPSLSHLFGTDSTGRDIFSRIIIGARPTLGGGFVVTCGATLLGTAIALTGAWIGGWADTLIARAFDVMLAFPGLVLAILAVAVVGPGLTAPVIALIIAYVPFVGRVVRSAVLRERALPYVEACLLQGASGPAICVRHLLPNVLPLILAQATITFGYALIDLAAISFIGLGVQPPDPDWGSMVATGQDGILNGAPEESLAACLMITVTVLAFTTLSGRIARRAAGTEG